MYESARLQAQTEKKFAATNEDVFLKLAENIITECGVALQPMLRDMISRGQAHELIKQHFGVK
jgi:hypothetical protein